MKRKILSLVLILLLIITSTTTALASRNSPVYSDVEALLILDDDSVED
ncbi:MAG: hypothetical protein FWB74_02440 [Defluviitaleaceae bacterium]|nr:hypothetical protein [Defluviitaleaceae bacterium]